MVEKLRIINAKTVAYPHMIIFSAREADNPERTVHYVGNTMSEVRSYVNENFEKGEIK